MKRSGKEGRWAELPPARTRFAAEAAFLILVAAGAALAQLSPLSIIGLMLVAWLLVALIERASSREQGKTLAEVDETDVLAIPTEEPIEEVVGKPAEARRAWTAQRLFFWRRERAGEEPLEAPTEALEERPSRAHVRKIEAEPPPPVVEPPPPAVEAQPVEEVEIVMTESPSPGPAVTRRLLELPGLEEPEAARASAPREAEAAPPVEPPPVEPEPPVEPTPPPVPAPPRLPAGPPPAAREWNIWELERQARAQAGDPVRDEEWAALFMHLRQYANADGVLPLQFDDLVRESFSELIQAA